MSSFHLQPCPSPRDLRHIVHDVLGGDSLPRPTLPTDDHALALAVDQHVPGYMQNVAIFILFRLYWHKLKTL